MKISFKNIPKFLGGSYENWFNKNNSFPSYTDLYQQQSLKIVPPLDPEANWKPLTAPEWYKNRRKGFTYLKNWDENLNYSNSNDNLRNNGHLNAGNLDEAYRRMSIYTANPKLVTSDILSFYDTVNKDVTKGMDAELFKNYYNENAETIRSHWYLLLTYGKDTAKKHNPLYRLMFKNRSAKDDINPWNIGYLENLLNIEGSSTFLRDMDLYENEFDINNPDQNRIHEIRLWNGQLVKYYKTANGNIEIYDNPYYSNLNAPPSLPEKSPELRQLDQIQQATLGPITTDGTSQTGASQVGTGGNGSSRVTEGKQGSFDWKALGQGIQRIFGNPNLIGFGRLAGTLINNEKIYDEALKGINPTLKLSYHTHRLVVGDEATKQAYYRRAAQGQTRAAQAFTSDADKQMAYQFEAKRVGDELRAQGDLADNQEIRRTSDESNLHEWANTLRDTEVANYNMAALNQADAARHNLLAQRHSAQWSSIDNYLQGIEYRRRQLLEEDKALSDLIWLINQLGEIENDKILSDLRAEYDIAIKKPQNQITNGEITTINYESQELKNIQKKIRDRLRLLLIEMLQQKRDRTRNIYTAKSGTKITRKKKDDLLYKTAKDTVEHFRKMSKLSSDALNRKGPKIEKLADHPKGRTKKYQYGGVAPFNVYKPVALGGETTRTTESSSSSKSGSSKKDLNDDLLKDLFKALQTEGLPSDTNVIFGQMILFMLLKDAFGNELNSDNIQAMYLSMINKLNIIKFNNKQYEDVKKIVNDRNAASELAVDLYGRMAVQDSEGKISFVNPEKYKENSDSLIALTNEDLLTKRAYDTSLAFNLGTILLVANNATSMQEIAKFLKDNLQKMEKEITEGYVTKDAKLIKDGIDLLKDAPNGVYKFKNTSQAKLAEYALNYLMGILPNLMKNFLYVNAKLEGVDPKTLLVSLVKSNIADSIEFDAVTGKGSSNDDDLDKLSSNPLLAMQREVGGTPIKYNLITRDSNTRLSVDGTSYSTLPNIKENMSVDKMLYESGVADIMDNKRGITFGDQLISPEYLKDIMYVNNGGTIVTLPCKIVDGHKEVNLDVINLYEEAERKALQKVNDRTSDLFEKALGKELHNVGLDSLLTVDGLPNKKMVGLFLVVEAYTTDRIPLENKNSQYIEKVRNPDNNLEMIMSLALSTDSKKSNYVVDIDDNGLLGSWLGEGSYDNIYRGTVFIPITNNPNAALRGNSVKVGLLLDLEELYLISNKSANYNNNNNLE